MDTLQEKIFESLKAKATNALNNSNYSEAIDAVNKALELKPDDAKLHLFMGNALFGSKKYKDAIKSYSLALEYKPDFEQAYFKRALAKKENKDFLGAKDDLQLVLKINPDYFECVNELESIAKIEEESNIFGEFVDLRDNQKYRTVRIGEQAWMLDFLRYEITKKTLFSKKIVGCWIYDNKFDNIELYGRLYSYDYIEQAIPDGWRLPSIDDLKELFIFSSGYKGKINKQLFYRDTHFIGDYSHASSRKWEFEQIVKKFKIFKRRAGFMSFDKTFGGFKGIDETCRIWLAGGRILHVREDDLFEENIYKKEDIACSTLLIKK